MGTERHEGPKDAQDERWPRNSNLCAKEKGPRVNAKKPQDVAIDVMAKTGAERQEARGPATTEMTVHFRRQFSTKFGK